jgi:response regulator RpfG family c-di-GMP phosphodiesterase
VPTWLTWLIVGLLGWAVLAVPLSLVVGRFLDLSGSSLGMGNQVAARARAVARQTSIPESSPLVRQTEMLRSPRILIVDDDPALRLLLRTTLTTEFEVAEAEDARRASDLARLWRPTIVLLDVAMPGIDGLSFCSDLKTKPAFRAPLVVLLTGAEVSEETAARAGADALLRKPFSPLELVSVIDRLTGTDVVETATELGGQPTEQILLFARDLGRLVEIERGHRRVLENAYRETVTALANALDAKDTDTRVHSLRVRHYATELTTAIEPTLLSDPGLEYGFLLHDVGKIGVPGGVLRKRGPLSPSEWGLIQLHPLIGSEILASVTFLQGEGLKVIRSHHERWDGTGYPDGLAEDAIPLSARIFAVADALDAITSERPYRRAASWDDAAAEICAQSGRQFDPDIVEAFAREKERLHRLRVLTDRAA